MLRQAISSATTTQEFFRKIIFSLKKRCCIFFILGKIYGPFIHSKTLKLLCFFCEAGEKMQLFFFPRKSSFAINSKSGGVPILLKSKLCFFRIFWCFLEKFISFIHSICFFPSIAGKNSLFIHFNFVGEIEKSKLVI